MFCTAYNECHRMSIILFEVAIGPVGRRLGLGLS